MPLWAQPAEPQVAIQLLGPEQGLPDRTVRSVVQDSLGFLWVGCNSSLWRYDGYSFSNYSQLLTGKIGTTTLVYHMAMAPDGHIWIGHSNGLTIVDPVSLQSRLIEASRLVSGQADLQQVTRIYFDKEGFAWVSMLKERLIKLDKSAKPLLFFQLPRREKEESFSKRSVFQILEDNSGKLYLFSLGNYIEVIDKSGNFLHGIKLMDKAVPKRFLPAYINVFREQGLAIYYRVPASKENFIRQFSFDKQTFSPLSQKLNDIYPGAIYYDRKEYTWFKSENEVGFLNNKSGRFTDLTETLRKQVGTETFFFNACISSDNSFWLCSGAGLFKITVSEQLFKTYLSIPLQKPTDIGTSMRGLTEDSAGHIWACSYGYKRAGATYLLHKLDPQTGRLQHNRLFVSKDSMLSYDNTVLLYKTIFTKDGMYAITDGTALLKLTAGATDVKAKPYNISISQFTAVYALNDSTLWLGCITGMITLNTRTGCAVTFNNEQGSFIKNIRVNYFMPWSKGRVLASTSNGLHVLDNTAAIAAHFGNAKTDNIQIPVQNILYTTWYQNALWAATTDGLLRVDTALKKADLFTMQDGLPDNNIYACLPDEQGNLWLSTNNGLCRFTPATKKARAYGLADGLPHTEFNTASFLKAHDGKLYFGGLNGVISFDPASLNTTVEEEVPLRLIAYSKYASQTNQVKTVTSNQISRSIVFSPGDRLFSFTFMAPDYRHTEQNRFRYKLEGWSDNNWHLFETGNRLFFNSLPPGTYNLQVQVSVGGNDWSRKIWQAAIVVQSPWYNSPWFYIAIVCFAALLFYALYRYRLMQVVRIYQIRNRISADMHDEIGSTLSSITFYSQALLMQQQDETQKEVLLKIKDNAQQVQEGLSDIIWSVKASGDEMENVFGRMFSFGSELLDSKGIQFHFKCDEELQHYKLTMTKRRNFYLIFKEAINNAAKYSGCSTVWVRIQAERGKTKMLIQDDGSGFDLIKAKRGNGLNNMHDRAAQMAGKLTIQLGEQGGTLIILVF